MRHAADARTGGERDGPAFKREFAAEYAARLRSGQYVRNLEETRDRKRRAVSDFELGQPGEGDVK